MLNQLSGQNPVHIRTLKYYGDEDFSRAPEKSMLRLAPGTKSERRLSLLPQLSVIAQKLLEERGRL